MQTETAAPPVTAVPYPGPSEIAATPNQQATQDAIATIVALKNADATTAVFEFTASPYPTLPPGQTGIHDGDEYTKFEMRKVGLNVENSWGGVVDGNQVSVWAGVLTTDSTQGAVHIIYIYPYRTWEQRFLTTEKHGSIRITTEQNNRLSLISSDGATFYFDVPGLTFVSSLIEAVPTATPPPTYTPVALPTPVQLLSGYPRPSLASVSP